MTTITLTGRPLSVNHLWKHAARNGRAITYMPKEAKELKEAWQMDASIQMKKLGAKIAEKDTDLSVSIKFFFENKARRDIDNYLKATIDCLTGVVWVDDKQISRLVVAKLFAEKGEQPRTEIKIAPVIRI